MYDNSAHQRMNTTDDNYREALLAAKAQSGMFKIMNEGAGGAFVKAQIDPKYGVSRQPFGEVVSGKEGGFSQGSNDPLMGHPYNAPMPRPDQTGNLGRGMDMTNMPHANPEFFAAPAERMGRVARGQQGFNGYNDRNRRA